MEATINYNWKDGEFGYCLGLVAKGGDNSVSTPANIRSYLLLQANCASNSREYGIAVVLRILARGYMG